jgi:hypothetical protein
LLQGRWRLGRKGRERVAPSWSRYPLANTPPPTHTHTQHTPRFPEGEWQSYKDDNL